MQAKGPDSHMDSADWHMVDLDAGDSPRAYSPALVEVLPMAGAEQAEPFLAEAVAAAAEQQQQQALVAPEASGANDDARSDGTASPTSERRADAVLSQPVTCAAAVGTSPSASDVELAAAQEELLSAGGPGSPSRQHQQHQHQQVDEVEHVRSLSRISQEGSLEGFSSDDAEPLLPAVGATADLEDDRSRGGWAAVLWSSVRQEFAAEWGDLSSLLSLSSDALQARLAQVNAAMQAVGASCNQTIHQVVKQLHANCPSGWALLSLGGLTVLAVVAVAAQLVTNRRLAMELKKRDRELARLVVKILQLQDALHNSARPILRHTAYTAHLM